MQFETEAYIDEYVIDGKNSGTFAGDNTGITYTPDVSGAGSPVSVSTDEIASITFKRDATLQQNRFLGWFFAVFTVVLVSSTYVLYFAGQPTNPDFDHTALFMGVLIVGSLATTYDYFNGEDYDVIVAHIRTDDGDSHVFTGRIKNTEFVDACGNLLETDIETRNLNEKLDAVLDD
ncbi:hypothetical protein [Halovivax gelatinilyticus]|uniref:hypothetical protein n=1 Tax=Halovivax gelatinilyticus TaxID=2961597 RepID=UPI0020CA6857|nr:hypothetical protein [Halovivax gelatinilyticus]